MSKSLTEHEADAYQYLLSINNGIFGDIIGRTYEFMGQVADRFPEQHVEGGAFHASSLIYMRLMQDLRCVDRCACRGYPTAAGTVASSIWELSFEIKYLSLINENAEKWFDHEAIKNTEKRYDRRLKAVMEILFPDETEREIASEAEWENYSYLSAFKHGNSTLQRRLGRIHIPERFEISPLPDLSKFSVDSLVNIVYQAYKYCLTGTRFMAKEHLTHELREQLSLTLKSLSYDLEKYWDGYQAK